MKSELFQYDHIPFISKFDQQYFAKDPSLLKYFEFEPNLAGIKKALGEKSKNFSNRTVLVETLKAQHKHKVSTEVTNAINLLANDNCYCVTSAHQPCLFGGPAYYLYKIASSIHLTRTLNETFKDNTFVPVFFLGLEDHDFEEINHLRLFGKNIVWQNEAKGAVGRLSIDGLDAVKNEILALYANQADVHEYLSEILSKSIQEKDFGDSIRTFLYEIFGKYGLVILNPDDKAFKNLMIPVFKEELLSQVSSKIVSQTTERMQEDNIKVQAKGREINLFYLKDNIRERIMPTGDGYEVMNTSIKFTQDEILQEVEIYPENFSPNVILRPLFQETILPSVAFIGGGGELAYWSELKSVFNHFNTTYPVLLRRNSVLIIDNANNRKLHKIGLTIQDFLQALEDIQAQYIQKNAEVLDFSNISDSVAEEFDQLKDKIQLYDASLLAKFEADKNQIRNKIEDWEKKLNKQVKLKNSVALNQLENVYEKIYPNGNLQERVESSIYVLASFGPGFIDYLVENLNPLKEKFIVIQP